MKVSKFFRSTFLGDIKLLNQLENCIIMHIAFTLAASFSFS